MNGCHVYWTKPARTGTFSYHHKGSKKFSLDNLELIQLIVSALTWRKLNGDVFLYTDFHGFQYLEGLDLLDVWTSVDYEKLTSFEKEGVDERFYWTAAKTWMLGEIDLPFCFIDHDLVVFDRIEEWMWESDCRVHHLEFPDPEYYPAKECYFTPKGYEFNPSWRWDTMIPNSSLLFFRNDSFRKYYRKEALRFQKNNGRLGNTQQSAINYLFADQRLIAMCALEKGIRLETFINEVATIQYPHPARGWPNIPNRPETDEMLGIPEWLINPRNFDPRKKLRIEHLWVAKKFVLGNPQLHRKFIDHKAQYVRQHFPEFAAKVESALEKQSPSRNVPTELLQTF